MPFSLQSIAVFRFQLTRVKDSVLIAVHDLGCGVELAGIENAVFIAIQSLSTCDITGVGCAIRIAVSFGRAMLKQGLNQAGSRSLSGVIDSWETPPCCSSQAFGAREHLCHRSRSHDRRNPHIQSRCERSNRFNRCGIGLIPGLSTNRTLVTQGNHQPSHTWSPGLVGSHDGDCSPPVFCSLLLIRAQPCLRYSFRSILWNVSILEQNLARFAGEKFIDSEYVELDGYPNGIHRSLHTRQGSTECSDFIFHTGRCIKHHDGLDGGTTGTCIEDSVSVAVALTLFPMGPALRNSGTIFIDQPIAVLVDSIASIDAVLIDCPVAIIVHTIASVEAVLILCSIAIVVDAIAPIDGLLGPTHLLIKQDRAVAFAQARTICLCHQNFTVGRYVHGTFENVRSDGDGQGVDPSGTSSRENPPLGGSTERVSLLSPLHSPTNASCVQL